MSQKEKLLFTVLSGLNDKNISFSDLCSLLEWLGFSCRIKGDHFIYTKDGIDEIVNIQPKGKNAKPYQVKQIREVIIKYRLGGAANV